MFAKKLVLSLGLALLVASGAVGQAVQVRAFTVGPRTVYWFGNGTGKAVDGLRIVFDAPVTLTGKVEVFGGLQNVTGTNQGWSSFSRGSCLPWGLWNSAGSRLRRSPSS